MPKAVKSFSGSEETRDFSDEVWATGVPTKNGWRKVDYSTEVIARKLPEQAEIAAKKVTVVEVPEPVMPVVADEVDAEEEVVEPVAETMPVVKVAKPAKKK